MWTADLGEAASSNTVNPKKLNMFSWLKRSKEAVHSGFLKSWHLNGLRVRSRYCLHVRLAKLTALQADVGLAHCLS